VSTLSSSFAAADGAVPPIESTRALSFNNDASRQDRLNADSRDQYFADVSLGQHPLARGHLDTSA